MAERSKVDSVPNMQPPPSITSRLLVDLYWYVQAVEAGSFSGAAERTGVATSSLSRRIAQLERSLNVQLLNRSTRLFSMTTVGAQVYRHALDMQTALESALLSALESHNTPGGLVRLAAPSTLADWSLETLAVFQRDHPKVQFALQLDDTLSDLATARLDLALSLQQAPDSSAAIVSRALAELEMVIVGTPALLKRLGHPGTLADVDDDRLLALNAAGLPQPWQLAEGPRMLDKPALVADSTQTLLRAARAGLGLAYVPRCACVADLASGLLQPACPQQVLAPVTLYAWTPPYKGITPIARVLLEHIRRTLLKQGLAGITPLGLETLQAR